MMCGQIKLFVANMDGFLFSRNNIDAVYKMVDKRIYLFDDAPVEIP